MALFGPLSLYASLILLVQLFNPPAYLLVLANAIPGTDKNEVNVTKLPYLTSVIKTSLTGNLNSHRKLHGYDPVIWDDKLAHQAREFGESLTYDLEHKDSFDEVDYNVFFIETSTTGNIKKVSTLKNFIEKWSSDHLRVGLHTAELDNSTGEHKQLTLQSATKIGCIAIVRETKDTMAYCCMSDEHNASTESSHAETGDESYPEAKMNTEQLNTRAASSMGPRANLTEDMQSSYISVAWAAINHYRDKTQANMLYWNEQLRERAVIRANACGCEYFYADLTSQSIYIIGREDGTKPDLLAETTQAVDFWWSRGYLLNFTAAANYDENNLLDSLDYAAMVWKTTALVGCAWSDNACGPACTYGQTPNSWVFWCEYFPAGLQEDGYAGNVTRPPVGPV